MRVIAFARNSDIGQFFGEVLSKGNEMRIRYQECIYLGSGMKKPLGKKVSVEDFMKIYAGVNSEEKRDEEGYKYKKIALEYRPEFYRILKRTKRKEEHKW